MKREYVPNQISIDGRNIPYQIVTARDYLLEKELIDETEESFESFMEKDKNYEIYDKLTQILALMQSHYLMRRVSYSCGTLSEGLWQLKNELIWDLKNNYNFEFDEELVGDYR